MEIRPIAADDGARLVAFHERLSPESQRLRFFRVHPHLPAPEVEHFVNVDGTNRIAVVATMDDDIVGVARLDRATGTDQAEIAVVVQDEFQGRGIATRLLEALVVLAHAVGITHFTAVTLPENERVRDVFRGLGYSTTSRFAAGVVNVTISLDEPR